MARRSVRRLNPQATPGSALPNLSRGGDVSPPRAHSREGPSSQPPSQPEDDIPSIDEMFLGDGWDSLTAVDIFPFRRLVCTPKYLHRSKGWGCPDKSIQFANFSYSWNVEVFWVDQDGALVSRGKLAPGDRLKEGTCQGHIWCVVASISEDYAKKLDNADFDEGIEDSDHFKFSDLDRPDEVNRSAAILVLRPSETSLDDSASTSIMWSPWHSSTISRRPRTKLAPMHKNRLLATGLKTVEEATTIESHIFCNVFDCGGS